MAIRSKTPDAPAKPSETTSAAGPPENAKAALDALKTLSDMIAESIGTLADLRAEIRAMNGRLDQLAAGIPAAQQSGPQASDADADDYDAGRDRDPGDAVPPGVAVLSPTPLTESDEAALHSLERLPKRAARTTKRGPRAKA